MTFRRIMTGRFGPSELKRYLITEALVFWGLIVLCWVIYPLENHYSIMTHTFSFLGSWEDKHNPSGWWLFSVAMLFWGCANIPITFYVGRRFRPAAPWGARLGTALFLLGSTGVLGVAFFPDARGLVIGNWEYTDIHEKAALLVFSGFGVGIPWHALLVLKDQFSRPSRGDFSLSRLAPPYAVWFSMFSVAAYFQVKWEYVYADLKAAAANTGADIGSHWSAALNTQYSFPLWENLVIYTLFVFLAWFALSLPADPEMTPGP